MENILVISYQSKHAVIMQPSNHTPGHLSQRNKNLRPQKNLYTNVRSSFICSHKMKTTQMSFTGWMVQLQCLCTKSSYPALKRTADRCNNLNRSQGHQAWWKKPTSKSCTLYDSIYITLSKGQKYKKAEQVCGFQGIERGWGKGDCKGTQGAVPLEWWNSLISWLWGYWVKFPHYQILKNSPTHIHKREWAHGKTGKDWIRFSV